MNYSLIICISLHFPFTFPSPSLHNPHLFYRRDTEVVEQVPLSTRDLLLPQVERFADLDAAGQVATSLVILDVCDHRHQVITYAASRGRILNKRARISCLNAKPLKVSFNGTTYSKGSYHKPLKGWNHSHMVMDYWRL